MKFINLVFIALIMVTCFDCSENLNLNLSNNQQSIVIDGVITNNKGPYYVRVTKSSSYLNFNKDKQYSYTNATPILNAQIIISDENGNCDTLVPATDTIPKYYYIYDSLGNVDSALWYYEISPTSSRYGYYQTKNLLGVIGHTYHLVVKIDTQLYEAYSTMLDLPNIDSISFKKIVVKEEDGTMGWVPIVYFTDPPDQENYYLFDIGGYSIGWWTISILSDEFLTNSEKGVCIDDGFHPNWWSVNYPTSSDSGQMTVSIQSINELTYEYYKSLIDQFNNDGGVYSPTPASPISNISNNSLGYFRASKEIRITGTYGKK